MDGWQAEPAWSCGISEVAVFGFEGAPDGAEPRADKAEIHQRGS
jgi:hypothetical protein